MELVWLELRDFRSHAALHFEPEPGINLLLGPNGSGKTGVLEAIGYLGSLRSFRRSPDASLVRSGSEGTVARGQFQGSGGVALIEVEAPLAGRRRVLLNGKTIPSAAAIRSRVTLVTFLPDDLDLVKRGPAYRREYLDDLAVQLWPTAVTEQQEYERALRQRNALLRRQGRDADPETLEVWDERLGRMGAIVIGRRLAAVGLLLHPVSRLYGELAGSEADVAWEYQAAGIGVVDAGQQVEFLEAGLRGALAEARPADLERRTTTVGPHRDEVVLLVEGRDARTRASQGEQRSIALGLRVAAYRVLREHRGIRPLLLLDDVFSELDAERSRRLVDHLPTGQVFVTSARPEDVPLTGTRWGVDAGEVRRLDR